MSENYDIDVPSGWTIERYEKTGHGKLIARFICVENEWELNIIPYKNYQLPGFTNCHRITLTKNNNIEVIAVGLEIERIEQAKNKAEEVMREIGR